MKLSKFRLSAAAAALVVGITLAPGLAQAQTITAPETVTMTIATDNSLTVTPATAGDFLSWVVIKPAANDTASITMDSTGALVVNLSEVVTGGVVGSVVQDLAGTAGTNATVGITTPLGADGIVLDMTRSIITDFPDAGLSLNSVTYSTATEGTDQVFAVTPAVEPVTVVTGGTNENVSFGGAIFITDTPDNANSPHSATFDVQFDY